MSYETRPWYSMYADAHLSDPDLMLCSLAAEGLLWRLISLSHNGEPYGYVTNGGRAMTPKTIAQERYGVRATEEDIATVSGLLTELMEHHRIGFDTNREAYFIPKMVRLAEQREMARVYGRRGGNPKLSADAGEDKRDWASVLGKWNTVAKMNGLPGITKMTDYRKMKYKSRLREIDEPEFWKVIEREVASLDAFVHEGSWFGFDFIIQSEQNWTKFAEGKYRRKEHKDAKTRQVERKPDPKEQWDRALRQAVDTLWLAYTQGGVSEYDRAVSAAIDKWRDMPRKDNKSVVQEAVAVCEFRMKLAKKQRK